MEANCARGEELVGNVVKSFGDLNCIFCLLRGDKMDSMANIGWECFVGQPPEDFWSSEHSLK
jgi:hypothetical protein